MTRARPMQGGPRHGGSTRALLAFGDGHNPHRDREAWVDVPPGRTEGLAWSPVCLTVLPSLAGSPSERLPQTLPCRVPRPSGTSCPPTPSSLPAQLKEARLHLAFGSHVWAQGSGVTTDGLQDPASCLGGPGPHNAPLFPSHFKKLPQDVEARAGGASYFG